MSTMQKLSAKANNCKFFLQKFYKIEHLKFQNQFTLQTSFTNAPLHFLKFLL
ncbi:hypothetical protein HanPSC8_Chr15g0644631 [Helianthus annuus]|nr:hypothetical protein HanPSC8_Chr15g0644631 [Helianthus annuus]